MQLFNNLFGKKKETIIKLKEGQSAEAYFNSGYSKTERQDYTGGISDYSKAIEINPNFANAYTMRGLAKVIIGQKESGRLDFITAGKLGDESAYKMIDNFL